MYPISVRALLPACNLPEQDICRWRALAACTAQSSVLFYLRIKMLYTVKPSTASSEAAQLTVEALPLQLPHGWLGGIVLMMML